MRERPILFSGPMVRAILAGTKTQTRRVSLIDDFETNSHADGMTTWRVNFSKAVKGVLGSYSGTHCSEAEAQRIIASQFCPYGSVGERLWVRETHAIVPRTAYRCSDGVQQVLRPDDDHDAAIFREGWERSAGGIRWRPSIHMPRWASRIRLEITDVRVQRLQEISEDDCAAEGVLEIDGQLPNEAIYEMARRQRTTFEDLRPSFGALWESINGAGCWDANPWVWAISFQRVEESGRG